MEFFHHIFRSFTFWPLACAGFLSFQSIFALFCVYAVHGKGSWHAIRWLFLESLAWNTAIRVRSGALPSTFLVPAAVRILFAPLEEHAILQFIIELNNTCKN